ncbi:hypothetical protein DPMN_034582 [Dreissena polymorpha]|uniref:Uncharacterized protein n=1 Tax=Dreissena polymorpha TaxID=45954 RepID=A0A9D4RM46_DREPO|nr:hypothetical protein DPMN_034582 [Dreissena polymorpha]
MISTIVMTIQKVLNASLHAGVSNHVHIVHVGITITITALTNDDSLTTKAKYNVIQAIPMTTFLH